MDICNEIKVRIVFGGVCSSNPIEIPTDVMEGSCFGIFHTTPFPLDLNSRVGLSCTRYEGGRLRMSSFINPLELLIHWRYGRWVVWVTLAGVTRIVAAAL